MQCGAGRPVCPASHAGGFRRRRLDSHGSPFGISYLQRIYGFYGATDKVSNVHLPQERHDFGPNKRNAVYDFFIDVFGLDRNMLDESKVTIEPENALKSFGEKGEKLPAGALRYKE